MAISRLLTHTTPISIPLRWFSSSTFTVLATTGDTAHGGGRGARRHGCSITPLQRRMGTGGDMLADAGVAAVEVDEVIPVGGATQMPLLPAMLETDVCRHRAVHVIEPRCRGSRGRWGWRLRQQAPALRMAYTTPAAVAEARMAT